VPRQFIRDRACRLYNEAGTFEFLQHEPKADESFSALDPFFARGRRLMMELETVLQQA